jgi:hypothetical protein
MGEDSFLAEDTPRPKRCGAVLDLSRKEQEAGGVLVWIRKSFLDYIPWPGYLD